MKDTCSIRILFQLFCMLYFHVSCIACFRAIRHSSLHVDNGRVFMRSSVPMSSSDSYNVALIIPTGVGAKIGGYAGDALPIARLISSFVGERGYLITHPNVVNGAMMYYPMKNVLYVEGYALDEFAAGNIYLNPMTKGSHKIGLLLDKGIENDLLIRHVQVAEAARATLGINVHRIKVTDRPVNVTVRIAPSGASWGTIEDQETLLCGAEELIDSGCTAIAVVARFPEDDEVESISNIDSTALFAAYRQGEGVDAIAGIEAIISHIITQKFCIPCAHAPAFAPMDPDPSVSPKACAEELGYTFLPCVIANLHKAPSLYPKERVNRRVGLLACDDIDAVIVPANAMGGPAVLSFLSQGKLIIAVTDNLTSMQVSKTDLFPSAKLESYQAHSSNIIQVRSYAEAVGILTAHREGILFDSITPSVPPIFKYNQ